MSTRSSKLKSDLVTNAQFPLSCHLALEVMVRHKEIMTTVRQIGPSLFVGSIQLLHIKYHFIILSCKKVHKNGKIPWCDGNLPPRYEEYWLLDFNTHKMPS